MELLALRPLHANVMFKANRSRRLKRLTPDEFGLGDEGSVENHVP
jgi:hypothetical protein